MRVKRSGKGSGKGLGGDGRVTGNWGGMQKGVGKGCVNRRDRDGDVG